MGIRKLSCAFTGSRESKLPYSITSKEHERLEIKLKEEILALIRLGVSEFFVGGQTGIDSLAALMVINLREEIGTTANLHLVIPYMGIDNRFSKLQKSDFDYIKSKADTITVISEKYHAGVFRNRNQHMIDNSEFLIAVTDENPFSGSMMTINMAKQKGMDIKIINTTTLETKHIKPKIDISILY